MTFHRFECIFKVCRIGQAAYIGSDNIYKLTQIIIVPNVVTLFYIAYISTLKQWFKIVFFLLFVRKRHNLRHSSINHIVLQSVKFACVLSCLEKFRKTQRMDSDFIPSATKFSFYITGQHPAIASCHVYVRIFNFQIAIEYIFKFWNKLNLIQ